MTAGKINLRLPLLALAIGLLVLGAGYLLHGGYALFTQAGDYHMHWAEQRYVWRGVNPGDVFARHHAEELHLPPPPTDRPNAVDPKLGPVDGAYPLSSYFTAAFITWPNPFNAGRAFNGIISLVLFAVVVVWSYRRGAEADRHFGWVLATAVFAVNGFSTTMIVGQYGLLVMGMLVLAYDLDRRNHEVLAGVCLGIALVKPSVAVPFVLPFFFQGRWKMLVVAGVYLTVGTLVIWPWINTTPWQALGQMGTIASRFQGDGYSLCNVIEWFGVPPAPAMKASAVGVMLAAAVLTYWWRESSMVVLFGIAAMASRGWSYHRQYDNLVLAFLLIALGVAAVRRSSVVWMATFLALGITLWLPARLTTIEKYEYATQWTLIQGAVWVIALVVLLMLEKRSVQTESALPAGTLSGVAG